MAEVDAVVDDRDDHVWAAGRDAQRLETIDVDVRDPGLQVGPVELLARVVEAPLDVEVLLVGDLVGQLAGVVGRHRLDAGILGQQATDRRRRTRPGPSTTWLRAVRTRVDHAQTEVACDAAALGPAGAGAIADEHLIGVLARRGEDRPPRPWQAGQG